MNDGESTLWKELRGSSKISYKLKCDRYISENMACGLGSSKCMLPSPSRFLEHAEAVL